MSEESLEQTESVDWVQRGARGVLGGLVGLLVGFLAVLQIAPESSAGRVVLLGLGVVLGAGLGARYGVHAWRGLLDAFIGAGR